MVIQKSMKFTKYINIYNIKRALKKLRPSSKRKNLEQQALLLVIKYQLFSIFLSIILSLCAIYINYKFIYTLIFLYPIIETGIEGYAIVRQEPGSANRYNAIGALQFLYFLIFIPTLIFTLIGMYFSFKITLILFLILYLISITRAVIHI